jgi:ABC-2 type transport system ATP-binding protein
MEEADKLCDRVAIIDHGQIKAIDNPETLKGGVGGDVVTLKIATESKDKIQETLAQIKKQPFFETIMETKAGAPEIPPQVAEMMEKMKGKGGDAAAILGKMGPEALKAMQSARKSGVNGDNVFNIVVKDGATALPQIFKIAENAGATIASISVKRPSLDDVFLAYTGRALREEEGSRMEHMMQAFRMRRARQ